MTFSGGRWHGDRANPVQFHGRVAVIGVLGLIIFAVALLLPSCTSVRLMWDNPDPSVRVRVDLGIRSRRVKPTQVDQENRVKTVG